MSVCCRFGMRAISSRLVRSHANSEKSAITVPMTDPSGSLGKHRYLLFDCYITELHDNWGNTFYSEIDVISRR